MSRVIINLGGKKTPPKEPEPIKSGPSGETLGADVGHVIINMGGKETEKPQEKEQFTISVRLQNQPPKGAIKIKTPPSFGQKPEMNWLSIILPPMITVSVAIIMYVVMKNMMMMVMTIPMALSGFIISVVNYSNQKKKYQQNKEKQTLDYLDYLDEQEKEISRRGEEQLKAAVADDPTTAECLRIVTARKQTLWNRKPEDSDFVNARIGEGEVDFSMDLSLPDIGSIGEQSELIKKAGDLLKKYSKIKNAPIVCNFYDNQVCGIIGKRNEARKLAENIIVQLTTHHFYNDLKIFTICSEDEEQKLAWVKDLPHSCDNSREHFYFAASREQAKDLLDMAYELLEQRNTSLQTHHTYGKAPVCLPYMLFIFIEPAYLDEEDPINNLLLRTSGLGVGVILLAENIKYLPKECAEIIDLKSEPKGIYNQSDIGKKRFFSIDYFDDSRFARFGKSMKPLYCKAVAEDSIPEKYTVYEMLGINSIDELDITARWGKSDVTKSLSVPLGISMKDNLVNLDIFDSTYAHGPNGLIAGSVGSGKSELLYGYIMSLVSAFHPHELGFFVVDYKSTIPMELEKLPHCMGIVRDIDKDDDGRSLDRMLASITAEINKRKILFAAAKVVKISDYQKLLKGNKVSTIVPHLVIIIDEFVEFKSKNPNFIKNLTSVALLGRAFGIHLILCTQNPSGQIDDQIDANTQFRICLKQIDPAVSNEVIKSPLAADIVQKGRAYLKVGNNAVFKLFQSGYSGANDPQKEEKTQREIIIEHICGYCKRKKIEALGTLYLPKLAYNIPYTQEAAGKATEAVTVDVGMLDLPGEQAQIPLTLNVSASNTLIIGSMQMGKTNLLQVIIRGLADKYSPKDINIYVLDLQSMFLKNYENFPQIGGVVLDEQDDKLNNLFKLLYAEMNFRRAKFSEIGVSSFTAYKAAGRQDLPQIVLLIDGYTTLKAHYFDDGDFLLNIVKDGITLGISTVIANSDTQGISDKYFNNISSRIALPCTEKDEYNSLLATQERKLTPEQMPGRCIVGYDKGRAEGQIYLAVDRELEIERRNLIREYARKMREKYPDSQARKIPCVPDTVEIKSLYASPGSDRADKIALGIDYASVGPVLLPLDEQFMLTLLGDNKDRKKHYIDNLLDDIQKNLMVRPADVYLIDSKKKEYANYKEKPYIMTYSMQPDKILNVIDEVHGKLAAKSTGNSDADVEDGLLLVIVNNSAAIESLSNSAPHMQKFTQISQQYKDEKIMFVFADVDNSAVRYDTPGADMLKKIRDERKGLIFDSLNDVEFYDLSLGEKKPHNKELDKMDAFYLCNKKIMRVRLGDSY